MGIELYINDMISEKGVDLTNSEKIALFMRYSESQEAVLITVWFWSIKIMMASFTLFELNLNSVTFKKLLRAYEFCD